jgi:uncharacterized protein YwqG
MNIDDIRQKLRQFELSKVEHELISMMKSCLSIKAMPDDDDNIPIGASKFGGYPDLPDAFIWPRWKEVDLPFLCQINLEDLKGLPGCESLPLTGWLFFFYAIENQPWGFDPDDSGCSRVLYYGGIKEDLKRHCKDEDTVVMSCRIGFSENTSIPEHNHNKLSVILGSEEYENYYFEFWQLIDEEIPATEKHQLLGYPGPMQGNMRLECQLVTNGIYCGTREGYKDPRRKILEKETDDWVLLLQIDTDYDANMVFGDEGRLYFWIRKQDLIEKDFSKVWTILQCG